MDTSERTRALQDLADRIVRRRLRVPTRLILDAIEPLGFLASQVALFVYPLTPLGRWRDYVVALEDEEGWKVLRRLVDHQDS